MMPKQQFALEKGGNKRLELSWKGGWRNFTVKLDGQEVGKIDGQKSLKEGRTFTLNDGSTLSIKLKTGLSSELQVLRDGKPLPGSASDPRQKLSNATGVIIFVGGLGLVLGLIAALFEVDLLLGLGFGWGSVIFGAIVTGLGFLTKKENLAALWAAIILYGLDSILSIISAVGVGANPVTGLIVRLFFLAAMYQGIGAIKALRIERQTAVT
jgi:hypothetical protein